MEIAESLAGVRRRIAAACEGAGRDPATVRLVAVSKVQPVEAIRAAFAAGQLDFGENYAQELRDKAAQVSGVRWHFLGALQTNKVKYVVGQAALVHTCDRPQLAEALARRAAALGVVQPVLIEVNLGEEPQKGGVAPGAALALLRRVRELGELRCDGLMCIPPGGEEPRRRFAALRVLRDELQQATGAPLPELSMGMSADYEGAIAEGATIVRVGTAIFGERPKKARTAAT